MAEFLTASKWEAIHGEKFEAWRKSRWIDSIRETQIFLNHLLPLGKVTGEKRLLPHQSESVQRVIYCHEFLKISPVMTTLATGTGKTVVMAAVMSWLFCLKKIQTFIVFCPNTIVRDRLKRDFETGTVFDEFNLIPIEFSSVRKEIRPVIVDSFQNLTNLVGNNLIVANRHQFQQGYSGGQDHLKFVTDHGGCLAIFNDEAHNTRGPEYKRTLDILKAKTDFRFDVTATPDRADNLRPEAHEIYNLSVVEAITGSYKNSRFIDKTYASYPRLIKDVVVKRPDVTRLGAIDTGNLLFKNEGTGQTLQIREIDWEDLPRKKNLQLVMDPGPMKLQLQLAYEAHLEKIKLADKRFKPLLFVIAPSIAGAKQAIEVMKEEFNLNPLLVVDDEVDYEKKELREAAANLGDFKSPYDSVVSVYMLREGWDVPEVSVICLLRGFGSPLFAHQVLGRGLRLIRRNGCESDRNIQELTIIDHKALCLDGLWAEIDALVLEGSEVVREREIPRDSDGSDANQEEQNKHGPQTVIRPELLELLKVPDSKPLEILSFSRALELLDEALECLKDYKPEKLIFVEVQIDGVKSYRPQTPEHNASRGLKVTAIPTSQKSVQLADAVQKEVMAWAKEMSEKYDPFATRMTHIYGIILDKVEEHLAAKQVLSSSDPHVVYAISVSLPQIKEAVYFELNNRIYSEELLKYG